MTITLCRRGSNKLFSVLLPDFAARNIKTDRPLANSGQFPNFNPSNNNLKMTTKPHKSNLPGAYRCLFSCRMFYA